MPFETPLWLTLIASWVLIMLAVKLIWIVQAITTPEVSRNMGEEDSGFCENVGMWLVTMNCQQCKHEPIHNNKKFLFI